MNELNQMETIAGTAVRKLRLKKLQSGLPFMINSKELPANQCYLEFPDGNIQLVLLKDSARNFTILKELSKSESQIILKKYNLA